MAPEDREKSFERALAHKLRKSAARDTSPSLCSPAGCPDVETLAAFHDCLLDAQQAILCKEHVVSCSHCAEIVSFLETAEEIPLSGEMPENFNESVLPQTVAASLPVAAQAREVIAAQSSERSAKRGRDGRGIFSRWLVPIGAIAAVSLVSACVVYFGRHKSAGSEIAANKMTARNQSSRSFANEASTAKSSGANLGVEETRKKQAAESADQLTANPAPTPAVAPEADAKKDSAAQSAAAEKTASASKAGDAQRQTSEAANTPVIVAAAPPPPKSQNAASSADVINSALQDSKEPGSGGGSFQSPAALKAKQSAGIVSGARAASAFGPDSAKFREVTITSRDGNSLWRLRSGGVIEHSVDGGSMWLPQVSGISTDLLAGSSPSEKVCWVVGRAGTILLTTDGGGHWTKIDSPTPDDLGYVTATDDQSVRIADIANRRRFSTSDGGQNWVQSRSQ